VPALAPPVCGPNLLADWGTGRPGYIDELVMAGEQEVGHPQAPKPCWPAENVTAGGAPVAVVGLGCCGASSESRHTHDYVPGGQPAGR
jgi:hypothetical protein